MIKPSIGRVVWYTPSRDDVQLPRNSPQPLAAIIAYVHSDTCVNLAVFDRNGASLSRTSVPLIHDEITQSPDHAFAEWMPYQKGQAAKTEAAEAAAKSNA